MIQGAAQLQAKLVKLEKGFDGIAKQVAADSVGDVEKAVRGDIGDTSLSGWPRNNPIQMRGMVEKNTATPSQAAVVPFGRTGGPLRVMQDGRNAAGGAGGFQGPGINRRTGRTSARARSTGRGGSTGARRWNGRTQGRSTWSDAERLIQQSLGKRSAKALHEVMAKTFRGS